MARQSRPWWWQQRKQWYITLGGTRYRLGPHPDNAPRPAYNKKKDLWNAPALIADAVKRLQAGEPIETQSDTSWAILDEFLEWCQSNRPASYDWYQTRLQRFKDAVPNMRVDLLRPFHVQKWLDKQTWGPTFKRGMVTAIKRVFNWAVKAGHIVANPLSSLEKPEGKNRDQLITQKQFKQVLKYVTDEAFRDLLKVVWWTGCRPQEIVAVEARHLQDGYWEFSKDESKGKRHERQVFLTDEAFKICRKWAKRNPQGPIFRNTRGRPWTAYSFNNRFIRLREKIGYKLCMYALRHSYAHHAITSGGLPISKNPPYIFSKQSEDRILHIK